MEHRNNIAAAKLAGLPEDLNLKGSEFQVSYPTTVLYLTLSRHGTDQVGIDVRQYSLRRVRWQFSPKLHLASDGACEN